ncbi:MAG: DUF3291 domain-containing protein [Betaproteobacteria bacterium]
MHQLAQLNVATMKAPLESPVMADFFAALERINALAEQAPGFVWRLKSDSGDATDFRPLGDQVLVNLSVWADVGSLANYVYRGGHVEIMRRRREWFDRMDAGHMVLWWTEAGHIPTVDEAIDRLQRLRAAGPSPWAFSFGAAYGPPGSDAHAAPFRIGAAPSA